MREVKPGDVVFHFVDNQRVDSYSVAASTQTSPSLASPELNGHIARLIELRCAITQK